MYIYQVYRFVDILKMRFGVYDIYCTCLFKCLQLCHEDDAAVGNGSTTELR